MKELFCGYLLTPLWFVLWALLALMLMVVIVVIGIPLALIVWPISFVIDVFDKANDKSQRTPTLDVSRRGELDPMVISPYSYRSIAVESDDAYRVHLSYKVLATAPIRAFVISRQELEKLRDGKDYWPCLMDNGHGYKKLPWHNLGVMVDMDGPSSTTNPPSLFFVVINESPNHVGYSWNMTLNHVGLFLGSWKEEAMNGAPRPIVGETTINKLAGFNDEIPIRAEDE